MFGKNTKNLETEVSGLVFQNPLGVPYILKKRRFKCFRPAPKAGFLLLTPPKENILAWIKALQTELPDHPVLAVDVNFDIIRTFSLVYDFADIIIINPDSDNGIGATDMADTVALLDEIVSLRLCYERYTPVFLRLSHGITPEELHSLLDTCQLSGLDGVVAPTSAMVARVMDITQGRVPVIGTAQNPEEALQTLQEGACLVETTPGFRGVKKLLKRLEND